MTIFTLEIEDNQGRLATLEVLLQSERIGFRCQSHQWSLFEVDALSDWLAKPQGLLYAGELAWAFDSRGVILTIEGVASSTALSPVALSRLLTELHRHAQRRLS